MLDLQRAYYQSGAIGRLGVKAFIFLFYIVEKEDRHWITPYHQGERPGVDATDFQICEALGWPSGKNNAWKTCKPIRQKLLKEGWLTKYQAGHRGSPSLYWTGIPACYQRTLDHPFGEGNREDIRGAIGGTYIPIPNTTPTPSAEEDFEVPKTASQNKAAWQASSEVLAALAKFSGQRQAQVLELTELFIAYSPGRRSAKLIAELAESIGTHLEGDSGLYELLRAHFTSAPEDMDREIQSGVRLERRAHPHDVIKHLRTQIPKTRVVKPRSQVLKAASQSHYPAKECHERVA